jgi:hypothetical protein
MDEPLTFWGHVWKAKWGILIIAGFVALLAFGNYKSPLDDCEANGGRIVIPRLDERPADHTRYKGPPGLICKYDTKAE